MKGNEGGKRLLYVMEMNGWVTGEQCIILVIKNECYYEYCSSELTFKAKHQSSTFPSNVLLKDRNN